VTRGQARAVTNMHQSGHRRAAVSSARPIPARLCQCAGWGLSDVTQLHRCTATVERVRDGSC